MKILVISQYYQPEPVRIPDICEELARRGHEVTVVTGVPNYPMGKIYDGYRHGKHRDEVLNGVNIHRCFTVGRRRGVIWRILNYYSYMLSSTRYVMKSKEKYDAVFVNQLSPVMMANAAVKYKKKNGVPMGLYCLDLWPQSLLVGGVKRGSLIYRHFHKISEKIYKSADKILVTSKSFAGYFEKEFGIKDVEYLPQYAEKVFTPQQCEKEKDGSIDLMFAGNIGAAQSVDTIIKAAALTNDIPNLRWHIVGDGSALENCKKLAQELGVKSVFFYGRKPISEMPEYYAMADAMLLTLKKASVLSLTLPGKVQSYMAAGKPIIGAIDGEAAEVIAESGCGVCVPAEDADGLAEAVKRFVSSDEIARMGEKSRAYYDSYFDRKICIDKLEQTMHLMNQRKKA